MKRNFGGQAENMIRKRARGQGLFILARIWQNQSGR